MDRPSVLDAKASVIRNARSPGPAGHSEALRRLCYRLEIDADDEANYEVLVCATG